MSALAARAAEWAEKGKSRALLLVLSGALTALGVTFPRLGALGWVGLVPALAVLLTRAETASYRALYVDGLLFNYPFSLIIFHWFVRMYPLEFTGLYPAAALGVVLFAWLGLSLLQSLWGALLFPLFGALARGRVLRGRPLWALPLLAGLWCLREWSQTLIWTGVPWGRLALSQVEVPLFLQTARWFGSYGVTFVLVLVNAALAYGLLHADRRRLCAVVALGAFAFQAVSGVILLATEQGRATGETVQVAAIQANIGSADKWRTPAEQSYQAYCTLSGEAFQAGAELVLWPETSMPTAWEQDPAHIEDLSAIAAEAGAVLIAGYYIDGASGQQYNALRAYDADGDLIDPPYAKRHPVPFGEYVPLRGLVETVFPSLGQIAQLSGDLDAGEDAVVFDTAVGRVGALICFDSIYEDPARDSVRAGAEMLAISTNDSWFFDSAAARMHLGQAQLRAVETGRYVLRAATTGISAVITPAGVVSEQLGTLQEGVVSGQVEMRDDLTLYTLLGNWLIYLHLLGVLVLGLDRVIVFWQARQGKYSDPKKILKKF